MIRRFTMLALLGLFGGCSLAPEYQRPAAPIPATWPESVQSGGVRNAINMNWQQYFSDPRLQALIAVALQNNRDLRIATARIAEARAQFGIQRADRLPNFNLAATRNASSTPAGASVSGSAINTQRYDVAVSLVSFELDFWGRVSSLNEAARNNFLATEAAQRAFRLSLISDVVNAYLSVLELRERTRLTAATVGARGETRDMLMRRREVGVASELDYLQAEGAYQAVLAERANLEQQLAAAENLLDVLLGQSLSGIKDLPQGRSLAGQDIRPDLMAGLPAEVLLQRPDVLAAEYRLVAANANIGAARAAFLPRITLTGSGGTASSTLSGLFDAGSRAWNFQPALIQPLFDAGRTTASVNIAAARKVIAVSEYEKVIQQAFREVADLLSARDKVAEQLAAQTANAQVQNQRLKLVEARYQAGIANYLEVLDAQREAFAADQREAQVKRLSLGVATQLYKALAGGINDSVQAENTEVSGIRDTARQAIE